MDEDPYFDEGEDDYSLFPGWVGLLVMAIIVIGGWLFVVGLIWTVNELGLLS